jgi:hypothetical protein
MGIMLLILHSLQNLTALAFNSPAIAMAATASFVLQQQQTHVFTVLLVQTC